MQRPDFAYSPLEAGSFRLLWIDAASNGDFTCTIRQFPIEGHPEYFALSYVWGDGDQDCEVLANNTVLHVSRHLLQGMRNIFSVLEQKARLSRWLWIDAICTDQKSPEEMAVQVPLMGKIYSRARRVLIWFIASTKSNPVLTRTSLRVTSRNVKS
jgi:hypothetical protein